MRLEKEFVVGAALERVWPAVKDAAVLATCLPGANLHPADDVYAGRVELTADGRQIRCHATVRSIDEDEDEHVATIALHGRQLGGPAVGTATVRSRCEAANASTRVVLSAELFSSGHEHPGATFETAVREVFEKAADLLEERAAVAPVSEAPMPQPEALPVQVSAQRTLPRRVLTTGALVGGAMIGVLLARRLLGGRRKGIW
jgi:carbon monoxide dehydrogenase subunit G